MTYYADDLVTLHHGDCLDVMRTLPDGSVHAVVTDPPYGLGFMGREWDSLPPGLPWARECLRVLKPGGHLLAFGGTRTWHRLAVAVEDAGFEVRDSIAWLYGSGFPKSLDVSKAIDKLDASAMRLDRARTFQSWLRQHLTPQQINAVTGTDMGHHLTTHPSQPAVATAPLFDLLRPLLPEVPAEIEALVAERTVESENYKRREVVGAGFRVDNKTGAVPYGSGTPEGVYDITNAHTPAARTWQGWGTAMKPAHEPVVCARKPFSAVPYGGEVVDLHHLLGGLLWLSFTPARRAGLSSPSSPPAHDAAWCVSARVSAALDTSPAASDGTGTYSSPALASTCSNIVTSWSAILAALSDPTTTSTTSTASSTTTALRTLRSLLAPLTSQTTTPPCGCLRPGPASPAGSAASSSTADWSRWLHTLSASAPVSAIEGIALAVASALATVAESLSTARPDGSAVPTATTGVDARRSAFEPVVVARKPLSGTVAANVLAHGTGALNVDACRVQAGQDYADKCASVVGLSTGHGYSDLGGQPRTDSANAAGRWPANVLLDDSQADELDRQSGTTTSPTTVTRGPDRNPSSYGLRTETEYANGHGDSGGASRFFPTFRYEAKAPTEERPRDGHVAHPTVKPLDLMRWLVRLVTPPGGTVLEPFAGSGTTAEACVIEGFRCIAIEREAAYLPLIVARLSKPIQPDLFGGAA